MSIAIAINDSYLDLNKTARSGQCFRWREVDKYRWEVPVAGHTGLIERVGSQEIMISSDFPDEMFWRTYLGLDHDYDRIFAELYEFAEQNDNLELLEAYRNGYGISILNQPFFETCISFLISQNNNIPRIKKTIARICGGEMSPFPNAWGLMQVLEREDIGLGYRHRYLSSFCQSYMSGQYASLEALAPLELVTQKQMMRNPKNGEEGKTVNKLGAEFSPDTTLARTRISRALPEVLSELQNAIGIGPKVAACIALFSLGYLECVPKDVWIRRAEQQYGICWNQKYAGYQQQLIFYW